MILIIEDDKFAKSIMMETLANGGYDIAGHANTGKEGIELASEYDPDIITLDYMLPDMTGKEILEHLKEQNNRPKIILISAINDPFVIEECKNMGIFEYLTKPLNPTSLKEAVTRAYEAIEQEAGIVRL